MVYFKENCNFPRFQRGSIIFSKGSLGVQLFTGGGGGEERQWLISYTHISSVSARVHFLRF